MPDPKSAGFADLKTVCFWLFKSLERQKTGESKHCASSVPVRAFVLVLAFCACDHACILTGLRLACLMVLSVGPSVCWSVGLSGLSVCPPAGLPACLSAGLPFASLPVCVPVCLHVCPSVRLCLSVSVRVWLDLFFCLPVSVSVSISVSLSLFACFSLSLSRLFAGLCLFVCLFVCLLDRLLVVCQGSGPSW